MKSETLLSILICFTILRCNFASLIVPNIDIKNTPSTNLFSNIHLGHDSFPKGGNSSENFVISQARQISGIHFYPGSPVYDSLLTRRAFVPTWRMVLLELALMTLSVFAMNAVENMMHAPKTVHQPMKKPLPMKNRYKR